MRKILFGAALLMLLTLVIAGPALAQTGKQSVSANEYRIGQSLMQAGLIPPFATQAQISAAVRAFIAQPRPSVRERKLPQVARVVSGKRAPLGRFLTTRADDPSATFTYTSNCLVLLVEFGDDPWPATDYNGDPISQGSHGTAGPLHGSVPAPAADDNATFWPGDFSQSHFEDMLFGNSFRIYNEAGALRGTSTDTMADYYLEQSKGTFTVTGDATRWVQVPYPESWYGANDPAGSGDDLTGPAWRVAADAIDALVSGPVPAGYATWGDYLAQYDQENPFGINEANGGAFDQPDGYIDHLIMVHAGVDESAGGGAEGDDAIWAHSWWVSDTPGGPGGNPGHLIPGTDKWVGAYTINPEDGGIGVFCHEFGHDLGLPDEYDTTYLGESTSGFSTLMASGSWLGREWGIDTRPAPMNAWDKSVLGFLVPKTVARGKTSTVTLQPAALGDPGDPWTGAPGKTAVRVSLPNARHSVELSGADGIKEWYSGFGNDLQVALTSKAKIAVPAGSPSLSLRTWYDIEAGYDWGFVRVSENGTDWTYLQSSATSTYNTGMYGLTGSDTTHWATPMTFDLTPVAGKQVWLQFVYFTDVAVAGLGWEVTDVAVNGTPIANTALTSDDWVVVDGTLVAASTRYYIAEYRTWDGYDEALKNCYQWNNAYPSTVDWYRLNRGLHVIYRDTWWADNDVGVHPGEGGWMVVDSRPMPDSVNLGSADRFWRTRIQMRDASFGLLPSPAQIIYLTSRSDPALTYDDLDWGEQIAVGKKAQPLFDDAKPWWYASKPDSGTKVPKLGVRMQVKSQTSTGLKVWIDNVK